MLRPIPEIEALRAEIQRRHAEHVHIEFNLITTFTELSRYEYSVGETIGGDRSKAHARQAVEGARSGIARIDSLKERERLESILLKKEALLSTLPDRHL